jgi:hypothetical protein
MKVADSFIRPLALFLVLASLAGPVRAQEVSESHLEAARKAIAALQATAPFDNIILGLAQSLKAELYQKNPDMQPLISSVVDDESLKIAARRADLEREAALSYARVFSEEELTAIADFYSSEAGKKLLSDGPIVTRELFKAAEIWEVGIARDLAVEVGKRIAEEEAAWRAANQGTSGPADQGGEEGSGGESAGE